MRVLRARLVVRVRDLDLSARSIGRIRASLVVLVQVRRRVSSIILVAVCVRRPATSPAPPEVRPAPRPAVLPSLSSRQRRASCLSVPRPVRRLVQCRPRPWAARRSVRALMVRLVSSSRFSPADRCAFRQLSNNSKNNNNRWVARSETFLPVARSALATSRSPTLARNRRPW